MSVENLKRNKRNAASSIGSDNSSKFENDLRTKTYNNKLLRFILSGGSSNFDCTSEQINKQFQSKKFIPKNVFQNEEIKSSPSKNNEAYHHQSLDALKFSPPSHKQMSNLSRKSNQEPLEKIFEDSESSENVNSSMSGYSKNIVIPISFINDSASRGKLQRIHFIKYTKSI